MTGFVLDLVLASGEHVDGLLILAENDEGNWVVRAPDGTKRLVNPRFVAMSTIRERPIDQGDVRHPVEDQPRRAA